MENEENKILKPKKGPITITLETPIEWGQETIKEITLKPIKGKHVKILGAEPTIAQMMQIASKSSALPIGVFDEMDSSDVMRVVEEVGNLL